jgi:hypothetical protein
VHSPFLFPKLFGGLMETDFLFPAILMKAGEESDGKIPIKIIPNSPTVDRQNDRITLKAFNKETIDDYLSTSKVIDYNHISILGKTELEKSQAIIGEAERLYIDEENQVPVCTGFLFKGNPYVDNALYPALKSGAKVYGASIGGKILQKSTENDPKTKKQINRISRISLNHIAICPLNKSVNLQTTVELRKSCSGDGKCKETNTKCNDCDSSVTLDFLTYKSFLDFIEDEDKFMKTMEAGSQTDISNISGGQAVQKQSLEGGINRKKIKYCIPFILDTVMNKSYSTAKEYTEYLVSKGFSIPEAQETIKLLAKNGAQIVKLTF